MIPKTDFEAIFRASPYPYMVMSKDLIIMSANDAYLKIVDRSEAELVGLSLFEAFPENPDDPNSTNTQLLKDSINTAIAIGKPHNTPFIRYAVEKKTSKGIVFEERYWSAVHTPVFDKQGDVAFVFQNTIDVTDLYEFDTFRQAASLNLKPIPQENGEQFNRAQMHQAMSRILNDERSHLRNIFNQSPGFVALLTGPNHVYEMANEAHSQLLGGREVLGKTILEAIPELAGQGYIEILDQVYQTGIEWNARSTKLILQRKLDALAEERYIDLSYQPYHDEYGNVVGIFSHGFDVTDTYAAQTARKETEERLEEGMLAAKMVVWDLDIHSNRIKLSDNALDVLGSTAEMADLLWPHVDPDDLIEMKALQKKAITEKNAYQSIIKYVRPDNGEQIWLDVRGKVRCNAQGEAFSVRGVILDVSERVRAEHELRLADQRKDEFLAMLAHELRNPLAPISAAAEVMKRKKLDEQELKRTGDIISRQIRHMTGLVDDLIDVSRVTRGLINIDRKLLDIKTVISEAIEQTKPLIESRQHQLTVDLADENVEVWGDHTRLVQIITNILSNAAKYTRIGGNIWLSMQLNTTDVIIEISDDGIGISAGLLPHIFELFSQAERTSDRSQGGLGIGLALVKSLVALHDGKVNATSMGVGKGSVFTIELPLVSNNVLITETAPDFQAAAGSDTLTVMIVDDNVDAAQTLGMFLDAMGYQFILAYSARSAIEQARTTLPDVFILDIGLPDMDGNDLARYFSMQPHTSHIPLIALTGYGQEDDRSKTKASGFIAHFVKPVDASALLDVIAEIQQKKT